MQKEIVYYKVTNKEENHHGYQYVNGLNTLPDEFITIPINYCGKGGFYFVEKEFIHLYFEFGIFLREVFLPKLDLDFKMVVDHDNHKIRANKIILGKKYSLFESPTYDLIGKDISDNKYIVESACKYGEINFLRKSHKLIKLFDDGVKIASIYGKIEVLDFFLEIGIIRDSNYVNLIDYAFREGMSNLLKWWRKTLGNKFDYSVSIIGEVTKLEILEWWKNSDLELKYAENSMDNAKNIEILDWWKNSGLLLKYSKKALFNASNFERTDILDWWINSGLPLLYDGTPIDNALFLNQTNVLKWWTDSGLELKFSKNGINAANDYGNREAIEWLTIFQKIDNSTIDRSFNHD